MAKMLAWQPVFTARTREEESVEETIDDAMFAFLREDEKERHQRIVLETSQYYQELCEELEK